jgi:hypothetical protein
MLNMNEEMKKTMRLTYELLSEPEMGTSIAKMYKNLFDALQTQGFSKEEAFQIILAFGSKSR